MSRTESLDPQTKLAIPNPVHNPEIFVLFEWSLKAPSDDFVLTISRLTFTLTTNYFETVPQKELESNDALLTIPVLKYSNARPHPRGCGVAIGYLRTGMVRRGSP